MSILPLESHLYGGNLTGNGYLAELRKMVIGSTTKAAMQSQARAGGFGYDDSANYFSGHDGTNARHVPWADASSASEFFLGSADGTFTTADQKGFRISTNGIAAVDGTDSLVSVIGGNLIANGHLQSIASAGHRFFMRANQGAGTTDYGFTVAPQLPPEKMVVHVDEAGNLTYEPIVIPPAGIPEYADDAARSGDNYAGVWRDPDGFLYKANTIDPGSDPYLLDSQGELIQRGVPAAPESGDVYFDGDRIKYEAPSGGTSSLATLADLQQVTDWRGTHDASASQLPHQTGVSDIKAGDRWMISAGGDLTGVEGDESVETGDLLIALVANPTSPADYVAVNADMSVEMSQVLLYENRTVNLAGAPVVADFSSAFSSIQFASVFDSSGVHRGTLNVKIQNGNQVEVNGLTTENNLRVLALGQV